MTPEVRPGSFLHGIDGPVAIIPGRIAALIERHTDVERLRIATRARDAEAYFVLDALHRSALTYRVSVTGKAQEPEPEAATRLTWMSSTQAAGLLHRTDRAIRTACTEGRLPAQKIDGRWRISRLDLENYKATQTR